MAENYFEILRLPCKPIDPDRLREAYERERTIWFLRQFVPEFLLIAPAKLAQFEEAYARLRDPRQQEALLKRYAESPAGGQAGSEPAVRPPPMANPPVARHRVLLELVRAAEPMRAGGRKLSGQDKMALVRLAMKRGMEYSDAIELVDQAIDRLGRDR
jgi:hypothetical protein